MKKVGIINYYPLCLWFILFLLSSIYFAVPITVGSTTAPSIQAFVTFLTGQDNLILGFASMDSGFTLRDSKTSCSYNAFFPVSSNVSFRGGKFYLQQDISFDQSLVLTSSGIILAAGNSLEFGRAITDLNISPSILFDTAAIVLNTNMNINGLLQFRGTCKINGRGKRLNLQGNAQLVVRPGSSLVLENVEVRGLKNSNFNCLTDSGAITLRNSILTLSRNYTFSRGSIFFDEDVLVTGTNAFTYASGLSSTINTLATLTIDRNTTFTYAPRRANKNLIVMTDVSSTLYLNACTLFSTRTGLRLTTGTLILDDAVTVSSGARFDAEALTFNNGLNTIIMGGANVQLFGRVKYE